MDPSSVYKLEEEIKQLRRILKEKEEHLRIMKTKQNVSTVYSKVLSTQEVCRYSRQMLVPQIGLKGQISLKQSKVLIVGAGGLGSPSALYLAAAGVGEITIIDSDCVEISNLHRQILHGEPALGDTKADSAYNTLQNLNSDVKIFPLVMQLCGSNVMTILDKFDVVVDGSDNVATRYMLNDSCVIKNKPLVSGSALKMEGQLTVYNYQNGPCYRCLFPVPPSPETVGSCGDNGVLGVVPGTIGILQALETIKILTGIPDVLSGRLLLFDACNTTFRNVKLRNKNPNCAVCGESPTVLEPIDYEQFCQSRADDKVHNINILAENERISVNDLDRLIKCETFHDKNNLLIDVRSEIEFEMCRLNSFVNIPYADVANSTKAADFIKEKMQQNLLEPFNVFVLCRRGNDSQRTVSKLKQDLEGYPVVLKDVIGGLYAYAQSIDPSFPVY